MQNRQKEKAEAMLHEQEFVEPTGELMIGDRQWLTQCKIK